MQVDLNFYTQSTCHCKWNDGWNDHKPPQDND